jgi:hypothetical protein
MAEAARQALAQAGWPAGIRYRLQPAAPGVARVIAELPAGAPPPRGGAAPGAAGEGRGGGARAFTLTFSVRGLLGLALAAYQCYLAVTLLYEHSAMRWAVFALACFAAVRALRNWQQARERQQALRALAAGDTGLPAARGALQEGVDVVIAFLTSLLPGRADGGHGAPRPAGAEFALLQEMLDREAQAAAAARADAGPDGGGAEGGRMRQGEEEEEAPAVQGRQA